MDTLIDNQQATLKLSSQNYGTQIPVSVGKEKSIFDANSFGNLPMRTE